MYMRGDIIIQTTFYVIESKVIRKFLVIDIMIGTGIYYVCRTICANEIVGIIGSIVGTEGIRRFPYIILKAE